MKWGRSGSWVSYVTSFLVEKLAKRVLLVSGVLFLSACGGGGSGSASSDTEALEVQASGVKGPFVQALLRAYAFNSADENFAGGSPVAEARSGPDSHTSGFDLPGDSDLYPLLLEVSSVDGTVDLNTGRRPQAPGDITRLKTVITEAQKSALRSENVPVYATPLTTLAVDVAVLRSGPGASRETFLRNLSLAKRDVIFMLGFGLPTNSDLFSLSPIINDQTTEESDQTRVLQYRTAVEAVGALVRKLYGESVQGNPDSTVTSDQLLYALAVDLADSMIDGLQGETPIPAFADVSSVSEVVVTSPELLIVPGTSYPLSDVQKLLVSETELTGVETDTTFLASGVSTPMEPAEILNTEYPRLVAAKSTSNTTVTVTFSEPMQRASAENPANYSIKLGDVEFPTGGISVRGATLLGSSGEAVELETSPQNEVSYRLTVVNVRSLEGEQLQVASNLSGFSTANQTAFVGTAPELILACSADSFSGLSGTACNVDSDCWDPAYDETTDPTPAGACDIIQNDFVDTDGDGIPDEKELRGTEITIYYANGDVETRRVTSSPTNPDTDGDGVSDQDELRYGSNARDADSDSDGLSDNIELNVIYSSPYNADSDGDLIEDGLEYEFFQSSPIHADTDGDQLDDASELVEFYRDPRIADLPDLEIKTGAMFVTLNEVYSYTDSNGQETFTESSSTAQITSGDSFENVVLDEDITEELNLGGFHVTGKGGLSENDTANTIGVFGWAQVEAYGEFARNFIYMDAENTAEVRSNQQVLEDSYGKGSAFSSSSEVTRTVESATLNVDVKLINNGDMAFSITDVEVTLMRLRPGTRTMEPVATLIPKPGAATQFEIGPFNREVGPLVFSAVDMPVAVAEDIMRNSSGIGFQVSNYRILDEYGREFTRINQEVQDKTAGLVIDYGYEGIERYQIAASGLLDLDPTSETYLESLGGFDARGRPTGLPLLFLLENQLGLEKNPITEDAIIAGEDGQADTPALGDDIQVRTVGTRGLGIGSIVVSAGDNGVLDSIIPDGSQNRPTVSRGFDTSRTCGTNAPLIFQGQKSCSTPATDQQGNPLVASECTCTVENGCPQELNTPDTDYSQAQCDGPSVITRIGGYSNKPGSYRWVALTDANLSTGADVEQLVLKPGESFKLAFIQDLDGDGLFARQELTLGSVDSPFNQEDNFDFGDLYRADGPEPGCEGQVLPAFCGDEFNPQLASIAIPLADSRDTDRDGLDDSVEYLEGWDVAPNGQNRRKVFPSPFLRDSDGDGLTDLQERDPRFSCRQGFIAAGENRRVETSTDSSPYALDSLVFSENTIIAYPGGYENTGFQTDFVALADNIVGAAAGGDDEPSLLPDYADPASPLYYTRVAPFCVPDSLDPSGSGEFISAAQSLDPTSGDTDGDGVSDAQELLGYRVTEAIVANYDFDESPESLLFAAYGDDVLIRDFNRTIQAEDIILLPGRNGTLDADYVAIFDAPQPGTDAPLLRERDGQLIRSNPLSRDTDGDLLADGTELRLGSNPVDPTDAGALLDSDGDGVFDIDESRGLIVTINGSPETVRSNPTQPDSDGDGLPDFMEYQIGSNPSSTDTDADGLGDYDELADGVFKQYAGYADRFESFILDSTRSAKYGTDPNVSDSDGDGLSDREEVEGFALYRPVQDFVTTNPLLSDTDGDGLTDSQEVGPAIELFDRTNPTLADTDGDGARDGDEGEITDPLVFDFGIRITIDSMELFALEDGAKGNTVDWYWQFFFFDSSEPVDQRPGELLWSSADFINSYNAGLVDGQLPIADTGQTPLNQSGYAGSFAETAEDCEFNGSQGEVCETYPLRAVLHVGRDYFLHEPYNFSAGLAADATDIAVLTEGDYAVFSGEVMETSAFDSTPEMNAVPDECNTRFYLTFTLDDMLSRGPIFSDVIEPEVEANENCSIRIRYTVERTDF